MTIHIGDLIEVRAGPRAGLVGRVCAIHEDELDIVRLEIEDGANSHTSIVECETLTGIKIMNQIVLPWPDDVKRDMRAFKQLQLDKVRNSNPHRVEEQTIRTYPLKVFGLKGGWNT